MKSRTEQRGAKLRRQWRDGFDLSHPLKTQLMACHQREWERESLAAQQIEDSSRRMNVARCFAFNLFACSDMVAHTLHCHRWLIETLSVRVIFPLLLAVVFFTFSRFQSIHFNSSIFSIVYWIRKIRFFWIDMRFSSFQSLIRRACFFPCS